MKNRIQRIWSDLPIGLLELIVLKISIVDVQNFQSVCSSWYKAAKIYPSGPCLMLPSPQVAEGCQNLQLLSVQHEKKVVFTAKNDLGKLLDNGCCYGYSNGWLFVLDRFADLWLLNLFSGRAIRLPNRRTSPCFLGKGTFDMPIDYFESNSIQKGILTANPSCDENYKVIIILHIMFEGLAFCNNGDSRWTLLSNSGYYGDIVWHENTLYALLSYQAIELWDLEDPVPKISISFWPSCPKILDLVSRLQDTDNFYLVVTSTEEVLVIKRYTRNFLEDTELYEDSQTTFCPYSTVKFKIWKFDLLQEKLSEVKSLGDGALFVGINQSRLVSAKDFEGLKRDSVYFSDGRWRGHDVGIFSLERDSIEVLCDPDRALQPAPCWLLP